MARVFITGSSDGLGLMVAKLLVDEGHELVLQGRNEARRKSRKVACDRVLVARRRAAAAAASLTDIAMLLHKRGFAAARCKGGGIELTDRCQLLLRANEFLTRVPFI